jgi:hypothetical protein
MYTEIQHQPNRWLQAFFAGMIMLQAGAFGLHWLPLGGWVHAGIMAVLVVMLRIVTVTGITLKVGSDGLAIRYFPYELTFQSIGWSEIRQIRLLSPEERLPGARYGQPVRDFTHAYWLLNPTCAVLSIALVNGTILYVSTEQPKELLHYLQTGILPVVRQTVKL